MSTPTTAWTEARARFLLAALLLVATGTLAGLEHGPVRWVLPATAVAVVVVAIHFDGLVGILIGLLAAALTIAVKRYAGVWGTSELSLAATEAVSLLALAWVVGLFGRRVSDALSATGRAPHGAVAPAANSLGLLDRAQAQFRLDEELARQRMSGQPIGLLLVSTSTVRTGMDDETRVRALRAVARSVEAQVRDTDVPFVLSESVIGVILPGTDTTDGWSLLGRLVPATAAATFSDRTSGERRSVSDCLHLTAALTYSRDEQTADEVLAAGLAQLESQQNVRGSQT